jgi:probable O-glycosylation ligase (exosortase A-associated)
MKEEYKIKAIREKSRNTPDWLFYGLLLFFVFEYARPGTYIPIFFTLKLNTVIPISIFIFSLFSIGGPSNLNIFNTKNLRWFLFFLFLIFLSFLMADVRVYVYNTFMAVVGYVIAYYITVKIVSTEKRLRILFSLLVVIHITLLILNPDVILYPESRHTIQGVTFLGDGNDFSLSLCIVIPFAIYLIQTSETKVKKILLFFILGIFIFGVIATQSRGGFIALITVFLSFCLKSEKKILIFISALFIAIIVGIFTPAKFYERMVSIKNYETEGSAQGRIMAWKSAVRMAMDNPLTGVGAGHFPVKYGVEYRPPGIGRTDIPWSTAHSIYFLALGEFGFPGIIFLIGIILYNIRRSNNTLNMLEKVRSDNTNRCIKLTIAMNSSMIGFAVGSAFLSTLYYPHLYVLAALFESANRICTVVYDVEKQRIDDRCNENTKNIIQNNISGKNKSAS